MTTDFRALCSELVKELHVYKIIHPSHETDLLDRALAALSAPEQGPTDEDLIELFNWSDWNYISPETFIDIARTVLEGWGRPAVEPVPVNERLPGPEDCDAEGRCWWLDRPLKNGPAAWMLRRPDDGMLLPFIAWLPHWALPVPQEGADGQH